MIEVCLLGPFSIKLDGKRLYPDLGHSGLRMAAHLFASPGRLHRREKIADMYWPEMTLERSRAALNSAIWRLRKILCQDPHSNGGKNLRSIGENIVFDLEPWIKVDTVIVSSIAKAASANGKNAAAIAELQHVIDLYLGPFMDGDDSPAFLEERERLHTCFVGVAYELLTHYIVLEEYPAAIGICRKVLTFDPYREYFVRKILGALCLNGQRAEAANYFERWQKLLREEIGVAPMPETLDLLRIVRNCQTFEDVNAIRAVVHASKQNASLQHTW